MTAHDRRRPWSSVDGPGAQRKIERQGGMTTSTPRAADQVRKFVQEHGGDELNGHGLRIRVVAGGCAGLHHELELDVQSTDQDEAFEHRGVRIFVERASLTQLCGAEVDSVETVAGSGFRICAPSAWRTCGCGASFEG